MMTLFEGMFENKEQCECGSKHNIPIKKIIIKKGAINELGAVIEDLRLTSNIHIVADINTFKAAGDKALRVLKEYNCGVTQTVFEQQELIADETALDKIINDIGLNVSCILAIGSGTINDLSRYVAYKLNKPYIVVATAPSMDGYSSSVSPLVIGGFKRTYSAVCPQAIIGDTDILKNAPYAMITAGFGDLIGKYISLSDWKLANCLCNEYYCEYIASIVKESVRLCIENIDGILMREENAIKNLMNGLVLSGVGMLMAGNSRPASGAEHHLSHFWEMKFLCEGRKALLHGHKVGVASVLMAKMYNFLKTCSKTDILKIAENAKEASIEETESRIKSAFGEIANEVMKENAGNNKLFDIQDAINEKWDLIIKIAQDVPESGVIKGMLERIAAPGTPAELDINCDLVKQGLLNCMYIRDRYSILRLFNSLGLLEGIDWTIK